MLLGLLFVCEISRDFMEEILDVLGRYWLFCFLSNVSIVCLICSLCDLMALEVFNLDGTR